MQQTMNQYTFIPAAFNLDPSVSRLVALSAQAPLEWKRNIVAPSDNRPEVYEYHSKLEENPIRLDQAFQHVPLLRFPESIATPDSPSIGRGALLTSQENFCAEMLLSLKKMPQLSSPTSSPSASESDDSENEANTIQNMSIVATPEEMMSIGQIHMEANGTGLHFMEKESPIRKTTKLMKNKLKQKRCSGACSEHKRRHQRCPMECLNRKRDEAGAPRRMSLI
ncbi:hypothetical protein PROFUN_06967 [Planoprotostelium fungivorum]|uniref:Uncharacterized protein n=1 Tax=Planoprotostelium fungivorum TaxID=1890364 RepID=A0A2P6NN80_9EUKA|nr:hypothetical protein PROFUN_06967 [Planoprotostelium fungivorum]